MFRRNILSLAAITFAVLSLSGLAAAQTINFEAPTYTIGNINGQDGWSKTGAYDAAVSSSNATAGFGAQSLRISNAVTSGSFGDQTFSKPFPNEAGETGATNGGFSGGTRQNYFESQFSITTTTTSLQPGLVMSVSPDRGDGARMSYLRFEDQANGIRVFFDDVEQPGPCGFSGCANFVETQIATLNRTAPHTIKFAMFFVDGPGNDVVKIYIDGVLAHTGTSWEDYFRYDPEASADPTTHTVDSLLFRTGGTAAPALAGGGYLIDNLNIATAMATPSSIVVINHSDINNWLFYNDGTSIEGPDPTCGSFVTGPGTTPLGSGSAQITVSGQKRCNLSTFQFAGTPLASITTLAYSTYNASATNHQGANDSGFLVMNVDFNGSDTFQRRLVFIPADQGGGVTPDTWKQWDAINGGNAKWEYSGGTWPAGVGGGGEPGTTIKTWNQILAQYPGVRIRVTDAHVGIRVGNPDPNGYTENIDAFKFGTAAATTQFDFDPAAVQTVTPAGASATVFDNDYTRINNAIQAAPTGGTVILNGTFDWTEANAAASWAKGSDGLTTGAFDDDNYSILAPPNRNNVTVTASSLGAATIQGPGDVSTVNLEGVFQFFSTTNRGSGVNQGWTFSNLRILDFDNPIGLYDEAGGTTEYNNTHIVNNYILVAKDLNATVAPVDTNQNIGIYYSYGLNQLISGNTIDFAGNGVSDTAGGKFSTEVGMQCDTSGGNIYNGLQITNNTLRVVNAQDNTNPERIRGIWENGHAHTSNIIVSGNQFINLAPGNNRAVNREEAFWVTSHSSGSSTVTYSGNSASGASIGIKWLGDPEFPGQDYSANQPIQLIGNTIVNNATGVLVQGKGLGNFRFNRIVGNTTGLNNVDGTVTASDNWWGCNFGPGLGGAGCSGTANGITGSATNSSFLKMITSAIPSSLGVGGTSNVATTFVDNLTSLPAVGGTIPNGVTANFAGVLGSVSPASAATNSGSIGTTYTAMAFGAGGVNTTLDQQTVLAPITVTASCDAVSSPTNTTVLTGNNVTVPINVDDTTGRGIFSTDLTISYDPSVVTIPNVGNVSLGTTDASGSLTVNNATPGLLRVSVFSATPFSGAGTLLNVTFHAVGAPGTSSGVNFTQFKFNEGTPCSTTSNGLVTIISGTITGAVTYGNPIGSPASRAVPNTTLNAVGSVNQSATSDGSGNYTLTGLGSGSYTVTPSKTGDDHNAISGFDSAFIAQYVVGLISLNANQQTVADVSGTGGITSFDAALIARYVVALPNTGSTGTWQFAPTTRSYPNVNTNQAGQDYSALLMGDVTGNWNTGGLTGGSLASFAPASVIPVGMPTMTAAQGSTVSVPIKVGNLGGQNVLAYDFDVTYDPAVLEPVAAGVDTADTESARLFITTNPTQPGHMRVVAFGIAPMAGNDSLVNLTFNVIGGVGTQTDVGFGSFRFNEGGMQLAMTAGHITVDSAAPSVSTLSGRVVSATGQNVRNARVTITDTTGVTRSVMTNSFGYFQFTDVPTGATYNVGATARGFSFTPRTVSVTGLVTQLDLIADK